MRFGNDFENELDVPLMTFNEDEHNEDYDIESSNRITEFRPNWKVVGGISAAFVGVTAFGLTVAAAVGAFSSKKQSSHATNSPSPTPSVSPSASVIPTPSVTSSVTPSVSPSASVTPSTTSTPSVTPTPIPDVSSEATYSYSLNGTGVHTLWITNNAEQPLLIKEISLRVNFIPVTQDNITMSCQQSDDQLSNLCTTELNSRVVIASKESARFDYKAKENTALCRIAMNPSEVRINNNTIGVTDAVPFNSEIASQVQPAIRYSAYDVYFAQTFGFTSFSVPYPQLGKIFFGSSVSISENQVHLYYYSGEEIYLPMMAFNRAKYGNLETFIGLSSHSSSMNVTNCDYRNYLWNSMNSTSKAYAIQALVNTTIVLQATGMEFYVTQPCSSGTGIQQFIEDIKPAFTAAGKKVAVLVPGMPEEIQRFSPEVLCSVTRNADEVTAIAYYWNETQIANSNVYKDYSTHQSPLNRIQESLDRYKECTSNIGFVFPADGSMLYVDNKENQGYNQVITGYSQKTYDRDLRLSGATSWRCIAHYTNSTSQPCNDGRFPNDTVYVSSNQNSNGHEAWAFSPTGIDTSHYLYGSNISYWVLSYQDQYSARAKAQLAKQNNLTHVGIGNYVSDLPPSDPQSLFANMVNELRTNQTQNATNSNYTEQYFTMKNEQNFEFVTSSDAWKLFKDVLADMSSEAIKGISNGMIAYVTQRISKDAFTKTLQTYNLNETQMNVLFDMASHIVSMGLTVYYGGGVIASVQNGLRFMAADLYLKYVVESTFASASALFTGANLGLNLFTAPSNATKIVTGAGLSMVGHYIAANTYDAVSNTASTALEAGKQAVSVASTSMHRLFKTAKCYAKTFTVESTKEANEPKIFTV